MGETMKRLSCGIAILSALAIASAALSALAVAPVPEAGLPSATDFGATLLPERAGVVSWRTLAQVSPVQQNGRMVPEFSKDIITLDKRDVKVQGFMIPLDMGDKQKRFLLSAVPPHCSFCMPAGPDAVVEVIAKTPVKYGFEPIVVSGRFAVITDDATGVLYRLTDAVYAGAAIPAPTLETK